MQVKIYVPKVVEIPSEYLAALALRAHLSMEGKGEVHATRGHLVRQAVKDGLLRELDSLVNDDGSIDTFCDPQGEIPLEIDNRTVSLAELLETLQSKQSGQVVNQKAKASQQENILSMKRAA